MTGKARFFGAVLVVVLAPGCGRPSGAALPPAPATIAVTMAEYRFVTKPFVTAGRVQFRVKNHGRIPHQVDLVRLPDDLVPGGLDAQLRSAKRRPVNLVSSVAAERPGEATVFAADLVPGRYGLVCFLTDADGVTHARKGMSAELEANESGRPG